MDTQLTLVGYHGEKIQLQAFQKMGIPFILMPMGFVLSVYVFANTLFKFYLCWVDIKFVCYPLVPIF